VPAYADQLCVLNSTSQLPELVAVLAKCDNRLILGGGSNILFRNDFHGLVVINQLTGIRIIEDSIDSVLLEVGAGVNWNDFVCWSIENDYHGLENLTLIPGTVGASPIQNIGAYGVEVKDYIDSLTAVDIQTGKTIQFANKDCHFAYRESIFKQRLDQYLITSVRFKLPKHFLPVLAYAGIKEKLLESSIDPDTVTAKQISKVICALRSLKLPDPALIGNAGSFFKNPVITMQEYSLLSARHPGIPMYRICADSCKIPAAWLIDQCGFKGFRLGDAGVYEHHALVLVNHGKASGEQVWQLARKILHAVKRMFGIDLVQEPRIL
jgi:UDP-N-acetylmuramate dehydrogenase